MSDTRYGHMIKKLEFKELPDDNAESLKPRYATRLKGKDLDGQNLNFSWGYYNRTGNLRPGNPGGHIHPYDECLLFGGLDYDNPNDLGAVIEIRLGEENEKYTITTPVVVTVPRGLVHCPIEVKEVRKPFGFNMMALNSTYKSTDFTRSSEVSDESGKKYSHLVNKIELQRIPPGVLGGGNAEMFAGIEKKFMNGLELNFTWAFHTGTGAWHEGMDPHVHPADESLLFIGIDPEHPDYLGAELSIAMGEEPEIHTFDSPAVVSVPAGLVHCPLVTRKVEKPYAFSAISLHPGHATTWLGPDKEKIKRMSLPFDDD